MTRRLALLAALALATAAHAQAPDSTASPAQALDSTAAKPCTPLAIDLRAGTINGLATPTPGEAQALACPAQRGNGGFQALAPRHVFWTGRTTWRFDTDVDAAVEPAVLGASFADAARMLGLDPATGRETVSRGTFAWPMPYGCLILVPAADATVATVWVTHGPCLRPLR